MPGKIQSLSDRLTQSMLSAFLLAIGAYTMLTGRLGHDPFPVKGPVAVLRGAMSAAFAVGMLRVAWLR